MPLSCFAAFFNITSDLLRTNQTFNVTIQDSCNAAYTVDFGDGTSKSLTASEKVVSHSYGSPGSYDILVQSGSASPECTSARKTVDVRDAIQNVVRMFLFLINWILNFNVIKTSNGRKNNGPRVQTRKDSSRL